MVIEQFLSGLKCVARSGDGWAALCPGHADRQPSLSVRAGRDGRVLVKCHRGCRTDQVLAAMGLEAKDLFEAEPAPQNGRNRRQGEERVDYDYRDEQGEVVYRVVRGPGKQFRQCRPDGRGGWIWSVRGVPKTLYRLPELKEAVARGETVYLVEGEKDVEAARRLGVAATCNSGGAGKWPPECSAHLKGARVVILPDNDDAGRLHAEMVAGMLAGIAEEVKVVPLPGVPEHGDLSDWIRAGGTAEELARLVEMTDDGLPMTDASKSADGSRQFAAGNVHRPSGPTISMKLAQLGQEAELFHSERGEPFARIPVGDHFENRPLGSGPFSDWLSLRFYAQTGKPPAGGGLTAALGVLSGIATYQSPQHRLSVRVAADPADPQVVWYDLADPQWRAIRIGPEGWRIESAPPILFRRYKALAPQAEPASGGSIDELRGYLNLQEDADWYLLVCWLAAALMPGIAHPALIVYGEQGSSKSTTARLFGSLIDPSVVSLRAEPRDIAEWIQAADHSWLLTLDNVSRLPSWLSDALCRAVTGEAFLRRTLYTNNDDSLAEFQRVIILTAIETVVQRPDLLDRSILLGLQPIHSDKRRSERLLMRSFEEARPRLFGALLDILAGVLRELPSIEPSRLPRLADFGCAGLAVEKVCGWPAGTFSEAFRRNLTAQTEESIASSAIGDALLAWSETFRIGIKNITYWEGTAGELLEELAGFIPDIRPTNWPRDTHGLTGQLRRLAPNLREMGIGLEFYRTTRNRLIRVVRYPVDEKRVDTAV